MKFYVVEDAYVWHLKSFDSRVCDNYAGTRPYVGIILEIGAFKYLAPLTSYKPKQDRFAPSYPSLFKIHEKGDEQNKLGILQINNMIPLIDGVFSLLDLNSQPQRYQRMLIKQLEFINSNQDAIRDRARKFYQLIVVNKHHFFCKVSCDFAALEQAGLAFGAGRPQAVPAATNTASAQLPTVRVPSGNRSVLSLKSKVSDPPE